MQTPTLRVVADSNNEVGDTLTRLSIDLFRTLGYDDCRINIHKTGRELDIKGRHAFEDKLLIAECKAQKEPIGGGDINKFVGVLDAERRQAKQAQVHGYYLSISGYKESAREQEEELGNSRIILLDGSDVIKRISESHIVVSPLEAAETAGRYIASVAPDLKFHRLELVAHSMGWLWAAYFKGKSSGVVACLVHADGQIVDQRIFPLPDINGTQILAMPNTLTPERHSIIARAYRDYLINDFGVITLEGLPVDQEVGSRAFRLEDLYVPLKLQLAGILDAQKDEEQRGPIHPSIRGTEPSVGPKSLGAVLYTDNHIAILGPPGSGKSTLVKRLAVAYADRGRMANTQDGLPDVDWFPMAIRCRHLSTSSGRPIYEILVESFLRTEHGDLTADLSRFVGEQLRIGKVLLLIDGLDEMPSVGARVAFVSQLRTFLARYPNVRLVITSREVGFRLVANAAFPICSCYRVTELTHDDIEDLVEAWHREVVGSSPQVMIEAEKLATSILRNDRVRRLAVNPLLLMTLLLVKRWVGQLPRKRTVLYQKAIEVLLMTWNVEGHEPIDLDEALPQLGYAAYRMMIQKTSNVSASELSRLFQDARNDLPELLAYSKISAQSFLERVEERSSLLVLSGHRLINGELSPIYEFKHLTFQEYLAALALANRWLPSADRGVSIQKLLVPFLEESSWSDTAVVDRYRGTSSA